MTTTCPKCLFTYPIAKSKRANPCPNCASIEKTGKSLKEIAREKHRESMERLRLKSQEKQKQKVRLPAALAKFSKKGKRQALQIAATKNKLKREAAEGEFCECEGCGGFFKSLDASHIIPLSQSSALASDPDNITLLCRGCHTAFENGTVPQMIKLKCFVRDMTTMFEFDNSRFWNIFYRLRDEWILRPTPKLSAVLDKLERLDQ